MKTRIFLLSIFLFPLLCASCFNRPEEGIASQMTIEFGNISETVTASAILHADGVLTLQTIPMRIILPDSEIGLYKVNKNSFAEVQYNENVDTRRFFWNTKSSDFKEGKIEITHKEIIGNFISLSGNIDVVLGFESEVDKSLKGEFTSLIADNYSEKDEYSSSELMLDYSENEIYFNIGIETYNNDAYEVHFHIIPTYSFRLKLRETNPGTYILPEQHDLLSPWGILFRDENGFYFVPAKDENSNLPSLTISNFDSKNGNVVGFFEGRFHHDGDTVDIFKSEFKATLEL